MYSTRPNKFYQKKGLQILQKMFASEQKLSAIENTNHQLNKQKTNLPNKQRLQNYAILSIQSNGLIPQATSLTNFPTQKYLNSSKQLQMSNPQIFIKKQSSIQDFKIKKTSSKYKKAQNKLQRNYHSKKQLQFKSNPQLNQLNLAKTPIQSSKYLNTNKNEKYIILKTQPSNTSLQKQQHQKLIQKNLSAFIKFKPQKQQFSLKDSKSKQNKKHDQSYKKEGQSYQKSVQSYKKETKNTTNYSSKSIYSSKSSHPNYLTKSTQHDIKNDKNIQKNSKTIQQKPQIDQLQYKSEGFSKQRKIYEKVKLLQKKLKTQKQLIKKTRKQFLDLLDISKKKIQFFQNQTKLYQSKIYTIQNQFQTLQTQHLKRWQLKQSLIYKIQFLNNLKTDQFYQFQSNQTISKEEIQNQVQQNSSITRKIYNYKQELKRKSQIKHLANQKAQLNKNYIKNIIEKEESITKLTLQKNIKIHQYKQSLKQEIRKLIEQQNKSQIYQRLDKQLNLIKQYFKISYNNVQFKKNIKKMTKFDSYYRSIQKFQRQPQFNSQIMQIYKRTLWKAELPRFLQTESLVLQSSKIRQLKNTIKTLQIRKQSLNSILKDKEKQVNSLSFKTKKLEQEINKIRNQTQQINFQESQIIY